MKYINLILTSLILINFLLISFKQLVGCIRMVALQGVLIGILPLILAKSSFGLYTTLISVITICLKGIIFPYLFIRALKKIKIEKDIEPYIGYKISILFALFALILSFHISSNFIIHKETSFLALPSSFFTIFIGLFVIISRVKAITQALGYLILENGIYMFSYAFLIEQHFLVELGILLDIFVAVFIMGITIFHIKSQFEHLNTRYLSNLKD